MNTPRTDAAKFRVGDSDHFAVHVTHAEQLERELITMSAMANRLAEALDFTMNGNTAKDQTPFIDASRAVLAAYENHKKGNRHHDTRRTTHRPC